MICLVSYPMIIFTWHCLLFSWQSAAGEADREPPPPVGSPHHLHRAHQKPNLQVLEPRVRPLCSRNREVSIFRKIKNAYCVMF